MTAVDGKEIELKFRLSGGPEAIRRRLNELGATGGPSVREADVYLDQPDGRLVAEGRVLRVRRDEAGCKVTYKGPPAPGTIFSERDEVEARVADLEEILAVLAALGYRPVCRKEKDRQSFAFGEVTVCVDRLPFLGHYLEIEGPRRAIARAAAQLGLDLAAGTNRPYLELYLNHWRDRGVEPGEAPEMLFAEEEGRRDDG